MGNYVDIDDIRDEGFTVADASDARVTLCISLAERYVERATGRWFYRKSTALKLNGTGREILHLPHCICQGDSQITKVESGVSSLTELDLDMIIVCNTDDDRWNPKLLWNNEPGVLIDDEVFYTWPKGRRNITVTGYFGFVDYELVEAEDPEDDPTPTWTTPPEIIDVVKRIVARNLPLLSDVDGQANREAHRITSETTVGRSISLGALAATGGPTGDPSIDMVLAAFRRPMFGGVV